MSFQRECEMSHNILLTVCFLRESRAEDAKLSSSINFPQTKSENTENISKTN